MDGTEIGKHEGHLKAELASVSTIYFVYFGKHGSLKKEQQTHGKEQLSTENTTERMQKNLHTSR